MSGAEACRRACVCILERRVAQAREVLNDLYIEKGLNIPCQVASPALHHLEDLLFMVADAQLSLTSRSIEYLFGEYGTDLIWIKCLSTYV